MSLFRNFNITRKLLWSLGRNIYTYARGDSPNDPSLNGEYWLIEQVLNLQHPAPVLLDVGANKGNWTAKSLELSRGLNGIHVHAFEPAQATRAMLTARFGSNPAVTVNSCALSDTEGQGTFYSKEDGGGTNSLSSISGLNVEPVTLTTIDQFLQGTGAGNVAILKIDTEGFDLLVLKGAEQALRAGRIEVIQFEYNWRWLLNHSCLRDVFEMIADKPYRLGKLVGDRIEFYDLWHFELDRFFENNYVLVRKDSKIIHLGSRIEFDSSNVGCPTRR
ncbi:MAG: FkbM family methyltransferase [Ilumatobacteraceae bacterium]|jgi:FkbM family methyltransferase|nr:FkbM family methyltransferase [Ilumatobacteraceae bacterium]